MKIFGVDPGTARVGWAVIEGSVHTPKALAYGCIETSAKKSPESRLVEIHTALRSLLRTYKPDAFALEELFFSTNVKTAMSVGQARGVIMLAASQSHLSVLSYTPLVVKLTICVRGAVAELQ